MIDWNYCNVKLPVSAASEQKSTQLPQAIVVILSGF